MNFNIILKINASDNIITRFAGIGDTVGVGFSGDKGSPLTALFDFEGAFFGGLHVVSATEIYIADENNNRIRKISCGDMALADCPATDTITTNTDSDITNGTFGSITVNPSPTYSAGGSGSPASVDLSVTYEIDLTNPAFIGHSIGIHLVLANGIDATDADVTIDSQITLNGSSIYSVSDGETITGAGNMARGFDETVDITSYVGMILTMQVTATLTTTNTAGVTHSSSLSSTLAC